MDKNGSNPRYIIHQPAAESKPSAEAKPAAEVKRAAKDNVQPEGP